MTTQGFASPAAPFSLLRALTDNWWLFLIRGIASIAFGVLAFAWPVKTLLVLVLLFGAFALVDGISALASAILGKTPTTPRWWLAVVGLIGIAAGVVTFLWPGLTAFTLLLFIAAWSIATGIFQIVGAIQLRKEIDDEWLLILGGLLSILFGAALFLLPSAGVLAMLWLIGAYAIAFGVLLIGLSLQLRKRKQARAQSPA